MKSQDDFDNGVEAAARVCDDRMDEYLEKAEHVSRTDIMHTTYSGVAVQARIMGEKIRKLKDHDGAPATIARYNDA